MKSSALARTRRQGFALVVTLSLMILLTIIAVGLLSLSSISLRTSAASSAQSTARANARMAMMIALGQLQKACGPDQVVTGTAELAQGTSTTLPKHPAWTGAWKSAPIGNPPNTSPNTSPPQWLVSGNNPDPNTQLTAGNSALFAKGSTATGASDAAKADLRAAWVNLTGANGKGRYAYWIGDEGTKAKINIAKPPALAGGASNAEKYSRSQSAQDSGLYQVDRTRWKNADPINGIDKSKLITMGTASLAIPDADTLKKSELPRYYLHDLTTGGYGLPVNVKDGGVKTDLSVVFDRSQQSKPFVADLLGDFPSATSWKNTGKYYLFGSVANGYTKVSNADKFYFSKTIRDKSSFGAGPNWGILWNYARLWENITGGNTASITPLDPPVMINLRQGKWGPYEGDGKGAHLSSDTQHLNSSLAPVVSLFQMGFYLSADPAVDFTRSNNTKEKRHQLYLGVKPIIGFWNPYNVAISTQNYYFQMAATPYLRICFQQAATGSANSNDITEVWMRNTGAANASDGSFPTDVKPGGGGYFGFLASGVDFQPGEFRLFSVNANPTIAKEYNNIVPKLDVKGTFRFKLNRSWKSTAEPKDSVGSALTIPSGNRVYVSDLYMQDTQWDGKVSGTKSAWGGTRNYVNKVASTGASLDPYAATSWITTKLNIGPTSSQSNFTQIQRMTNIWNGGKNETAMEPFIPEPIVSDGAGSTSKKANYAIESLVNTPTHIGTWRFFLRNPTEAQDPGQGLRGWIDSNPRAPATNLRFDGSMTTDTKRDGWNMASQLLAARNTDPGKVGDGSGGDRGLVSEGAVNLLNVMPAGDTSDINRWRGRGGPTSGDAGFTHVPVYDVPRGPLVSLGQFQHAQLSRYNSEPGFVVGNSYANPRIPLNLRESILPADSSLPAQATVEVTDISYDANERLWDSVFFSTLAPDYKKTGNPPGSYSNTFEYRSLLAGTQTLPNPRMIFAPQAGDAQLKDVTDILDSGGIDAPRTLASRILIDGGFNVNSTSKTAWKAVLSSMGASELPWINPTNTGTTSWLNPVGVRFNRFSSVIGEDSYKKGDGAVASFWQGWRELSDAELDQLAGQMVQEVKARGPFRSMAEFVNRKLNGTTAQQRKGALQAALDDTINTTAAIPTSVAKAAAQPSGNQFSQAISGENQAVGNASYLMQGDVLQSLAPILQVRSDYFRIRTSGQALDARNNILATAYCEAFVQRIASYTDSTLNKPEAKPTDSNFSNTNKIFGRRFQIVSFRWLTEAEVQS